MHYEVSIFTADGTLFLPRTNSFFLLSRAKKAANHYLCNARNTMAFIDQYHDGKCLALYVRGKDPSGKRMPWMPLI